MAILNQKRILNLIPKVSAPVTIHVSQGDVGTQIEFTLVKGDEVFSDTGNLIASVHGIREDGANFGPFACTLSNSKVIFPLHAEMTAVKGSALAEIVLVDNGGNKIGSANFGVLVEESVFPLGVTYDNDVSVYESILTYVQTIPAQVEADITAAVAQETQAREAADSQISASLATLNTNLSNEISSRVNSELVINERIDEIVAPSGEAPSAAEVTDARIGEDGTTYNTLGNAIRTQIQKALSRTSAYFGIWADLTDFPYITYNYSTKVITFPSGSFIYRDGLGRSTQSQTIDLTNKLVYDACAFFVNNSNGNIYAKAWNSRADNKNDEFIGYVYKQHVHINGVSETQIKVVNDSGDVINVPFQQKGAYIGISHNFYVEFNTTDKTITIPPGNFYIYHGIGRGVGAGYVISFSNVIHNEAALFFMKSDGTIYATDWMNNLNSIQASSDELLGYAYRNTLYLNGVPNERIRIVGDNYNKFVYCFGDSITAGVGTDKAYHMYFHDWLPKCRFKNYGIGSTGYLTETSDNVIKGNGVEGIGTRTQEAGSNTVLDVMQSIEDDMSAILISAGTNDFGSSKTAEAFRTSVQNTLDYAQTKTPNVFVMTPIKRVWSSGTNSVGLYLKDYCDIIVGECETRGITYSVGYDVSLDPLNTVCKTNFIPDGLHPNAKGHMRMVRNFFEKMREALGE